MLLIIFIITVPALEFTTEVTPPERNTDQTTDKITNQVEIALTEKGELIWTENWEDGTKSTRTVAMNTLKDELAAIFQQRPYMTLTIKADGKRPYDEVMSICNYADDANIKKVFLVTSQRQD